MSEQDGRQTSILPRPPANADKEAWKAYWRAQGQEWRTEPEIDVVRQKYLDVRRAIKPDFKQGVYPFKDVKLSRADIEWLLATREHGRGPIEWIGGSQLANTSDESQQEPKGIDIRGADLRQVDLSYLPLTLMRGALGVIDWTSALKEQCDLPVTHLEESNLNNAHLEGADLIGVHLEGAS